MPNVIRRNDPNTAGGLANGSVATTVLVNGLPCAVIGTIITPHAPWGPPHPPHDAATITSGVSSVLVEGKPIAIVGSSNSCGHTMAIGSPDVKAG